MTNTDDTHGVSRRKFLGGTAAGVIGAGVLGTGVLGTSVGAQTVGAAPASAAPGGFLVGAGRGDITGAIAGQGMMGYSDLDQVASGLLQRI